MIDEGTLSANLLGFRLKSFAFERSAEVGGVAYALFHRTETESESKLRPRLLSLWLVVPQEWVLFDEAADTLRIAADGLPPVLCPPDGWRRRRSPTGSPSRERSGGA